MSCHLVTKLLRHQFLPRLFLESVPRQDFVFFTTKIQDRKKLSGFLLQTQIFHVYISKKIPDTYRMEMSGITVNQGVKTD